MPTQLPREATDFFGELLLPHVENILKSSADKDFDDAEQKKMGDIVAGSVITTNDRRADKFKYRADVRREKSAAMIEGDFSSASK